MCSGVSRFILLFCFLVAVPAIGRAAQDISVKVEVDRAFATIGDLINFRVTVSHKPDIVILELDPKEVLRDFEIKEIKDLSAQEGGNTLEGKNYVIANYALGEYVIRSFTIQYRKGQGNIQELKTNSLYITIQSIEKHKDPNADIRGVKGVHKIKGPIWVWFALFGLPLAGGGAWLIYQMRKRGVFQVSEEPPLSPHDEAYQALNRLQHTDLIRRGQVKLYFFQMSEILRRYFERRYEIRALESTTYELTTELKEKVATDNLNLISETLSLCDLVKFAKYEPPPIEILRQNNQAKLIVDRTKEEPQEVLPEAIKG